MAKIDRLGWAAGTCFVSYGVRIGIRVNKPEVLERLAEHLPPGWKASRSPIVEAMYSLRIGGRVRPNVRRYNLLYSGVVRRARTMNLDKVFEVLESELRLDVASAARRRVFMHAGVVGLAVRRARTMNLDKGSELRLVAIVIPGRSFSGKTTLVAELLRAGATYYSDEFAVFDARGRVHPYPKPLSIREKDGNRTRSLPAEALGSLQGIKPLPVNLVVLPRYRSGARWRPTRLSPGRAMLELLANTVPVRRRPEASLATLQQIVSDTMILKGVRGEASEMADSLLTMGA